MADKESQELPPVWQKLQILSGVLTSLLLPVVIAVIGNSVNTSIKANEIGLSYVELAVSILKEKPSPESENLREWAIDVVNSYSKVGLSEAARKELKQEQIPTGLDLISSFEGSPTFTVITDPVGVKTIGYGHALSSKELETGTIIIDSQPIDFKNGITQEQAKKLLAQDLQPARDTVDELVKVSLTPNQRDALVSFVFNVGPAAFENSTLLRVLNQGKYDEVPEQLRRWDMVGGSELPALTQRREAEIQLWNKK